MKKRTTRIALLMITIMLFTLTSCKKKYQVVFNLNGGIANYTQVEVKKGKCITQPDHPTKEGYIFKGFELDGKLFDFSTPIEQNITLNAKWSKVYEVKFVDDNQTIDTQVIEEGMQVERINDLEKPNHIFDGWYVDDTLFDFSTPITKDITLTSHWKKVFTVIFESDGQIIDTKRVEENMTVEQINDLEKPNHIFDGWYVGDTLFDFFTPITKDITLTSHWKKVYMVTFESDGQIIDTKRVEENMTVEKINDLEKPNHIFDGWYVDDTLFDFSTPITKDITLTSHWRRIYTITFDSDNETEGMTQTIEENQKVEKPVDPKKDHATFIGWYLNDVAYNFDSVVTEDMILVAKWKLDYKVTIHLNNGEADLVYYAKEKQKLYECIPLINPVYENHEFVNYCFDEELTKEVNDYYKIITSDMDLYVLWSEYYTITYHLDGGVCEDLIEKYSKNNTLYNPLKLKTPKKEGYYFRGYYLESDFSGSRFYQVNQGQCENLELYAKWEEATLENAYIGFLGDSITTYKGYVPSGYAYFPYDTLFSVDKTWWKMTQEALGCKLGVNNSYSGTCVLERYGNGMNSGETIPRLEKCKRFDQIDPDILVVFMGMNDCLVEPSNVTVAEFEKSYENMINNIYTLYPDVQLFVCTLTYDVNYQSKPNLDAHLTQKENFNQVIRKIANNYQIPVIEFANAFNSKEYLVDTVHPNALGMAELSKLAVEEIKKFFAK